MVSKKLKMPSSKMVLTIGFSVVVIGLYATYYYFLLDYVKTVKDTCSLSNQNNKFAEFYFYFLIVALAILLVVPITTYSLAKKYKISTNNLKILELVSHILPVILGIFIYRFIDEAQDKCKLNKRLHGFGEFFRFANIFGIIFGIFNIGTGLYVLSASKKE